MTEAAATGPVTVEDDANGLAAMLSELIRQNLQRDPARRKLLERDGTYTIVAHDIGLTVSLRTGHGRLEVTNGRLEPRAAVRIRADAATLLAFSAVPLRLGQPDVLTREGRSAVGKLFSGRIKVKGLARHPGMLARLNRLLSAN